MKFTPKQKYLLIGVLVVAIFGITLYVQNQLNSKIIHYNFLGTDFEFRDDLKSSQNISVYPDSNSVFRTVWDPARQNVRIVFMNSTDNNITAVNAFEITYKINIAYQKFNWIINFTGEQVNSYANLKGNNQTLVIALIPPIFANNTSVMVDNNVVYISGKTPSGLDMASIRFIMSALNITV